MSDKYRRVRDIQAAPSAAAPARQAGPAPVKALLAILSVLTLLVSGLGYFSVGRLGSDVASAGNLLLGGGQGLKGKAPDGATDILLVGSDSRTDAQGNPLSDEELERLRAGVDDGEENTDTLMVIRVPNDGSSATAVSIPRDTYIADDEHGNMKINGVFAAHKSAKMEELIEGGAAGGSQTEKMGIEAGRQGLISAVSDLTGIEVDHYAEIGLFGFVLLTDAVGGVDVCLNDDVQDEFSGADFHAGVQTLDGAQALAFVRQRHGLPRGDLDRIVRQQAYMASLVNKVLAAGTLTNPSKLSDMGTAVERSVVIDDNWDIMSFATQLANLAGGNVVFNTIPVTSIDGVGDYGESIVTVDVPTVHAFMDELLGSKDGSEEAETSEEAPVEAKLEGKDIHVLNAGVTTGLAGNVGGWLNAEGYSVVEVTNALPGIYTVSQVVAADPTDPAALALAEALGGLEVTANDGLDSDTLIVVTHDDWTGPLGDASLVGDSSIGPSTGAGVGAGEEEVIEESETVGTPGSDFGEAEVAPEIDAGGDGPRCVN